MTSDPLTTPPPPSGGTTPETWTGELSDMEQKADCDSLEDLHHRRRVLVAQLAPLKALHAHNGLFDRRASQFRAALKIRWRLTPLEGIKVTDDSVDAMASADVQYEKYLDEALSDRIAYITMQNDLDDLNDRIQNRTMALSVYGKEIGLR